MCPCFRPLGSPASLERAHNTANSPVIQARPSSPPPFCDLPSTRSLRTEETANRSSPEHLSPFFPALPPVWLTEPLMGILYRSGCFLRLQARRLSSNSSRWEREALPFRKASVNNRGKGAFTMQRDSLGPHGSWEQREAVVGWMSKRQLTSLNGRGKRKRKTLHQYLPLVLCMYLLYFKMATSLQCKDR